VLTVQSARGYWDKQAWAATADDAVGVQPEPEGPLAVLTRASILPSKAMAFWRYAPAAQAELNQSDGCLLSMGLGEAPLVRQCTFSLWRDTVAMSQFAHRGAHQLASSAAYKNEFFSESMFVRMRVLQMSGAWQGQHLDKKPMEFSHA
jgi:spheroidene monooxygenase